jgi:hypothetical protein
MVIDAEPIAWIISQDALERPPLKTRDHNAKDEVSEAFTRCERLASSDPRLDELMAVVEHARELGGNFGAIKRTMLSGVESGHDAELPCECGGCKVK